MSAAAVRRRLSAALRRRLVRSGAARGRARAHARAVADSRRGAARAPAARPRDHGRAQRRDDEHRPVAPAQVSDSLPGSRHVHHAAADAALVGRRLPPARSVRAASAMAAVRGKSLLLRRRRARVSKEKIVVLGAGPAGMSAAWRLSELGYPVTVLEKDSAVGGMGKTIAVGKYAVDYGPHTFHIRETEESRAIHESIRHLFGDDPLILTRGTRVLLRGKEYVYPLEMLQVLTGVSPLLATRIVLDYVTASVKSTLAPPRNEHSFEEWG